MNTSYRTISRNIVGKLTPNETYTYFCLLSKSDFKTGESHVKQKTLCELTGIKKLDTLQAHLKRFYELNILFKKTESKNGNLGYFRVNTYFYDIPKENWVRINLNLIDKDISSKIKGFLILLKCLAVNNSNFIGYNKSQLSKKLNMDIKTIRKYLDNCTGNNLIKELDNGFLILDNSLFMIDRDSKKRSIYNDIYKAIQDFCTENKYLPPNFDKNILSQIFAHYQGEFLLERLNEKCKGFSTNQYYDLKYFAKAMGITLHEKIKPSIHPIIIS